MSLPTIEIMVPTERLQRVNGAQPKVPIQAKLLPATPSVYTYPGGKMDIRVSEEVAAELEVGDMLAVPPNSGEPQPFKVTESPRPMEDSPDHWVRVVPGRDPKTIHDELAEQNARETERRRQEQSAAAAQVERKLDATERGVEILREAGFEQLAEAIEREADTLALRYALSGDVANMPEDSEAEETEAVA